VSTDYLSLSTDRCLTTSFDSLEAFMDDIKRPGALAEGITNRSDVVGKANWFGTGCFEDAIALAERGWETGLARIKALTGTLKQLHGDKADRHFCRYSEAGDEVDIGRYMTGESEHMIDWEVQQVPAAGRVVKVVFNMAASSAISTEQMFMRGAAAVMLVDLIEQSGLRCEVVLACGTCRDGEAGSSTTVVIKQASQPVEMDRLAYMLCNASVLRRLFFRFFEKRDQAEFNRYYGCSYGTPMNVKVDGDDVIEVDALQYGFGNNITEDNCKAFVDAMVSRYMEGNVATV